MIREYKFGPWLPEATDYKNPGLEVAKNCVPSPNGYNPVYGLSGTGASVTGTIIGAQSFERKDGTIVVCVATTSDLYTIVSGTANASSLSLSLTAGTDRVVFEQFDAEVYATTKGGDAWYLTNIESDTTFSAVSGTIPKANAMGRVQDFLVMGDYNDGTDYPFRVAWSPFNNPSGTWGTDIATQTDSQPLDAQQGPVTAISGGTFGIVFQKNGISRMTYVGGSSVFAFDLFEKNRGCIAPLSVARVGDTAYFLSYDGFFRTDGASVQSISRGRVWEWFIENTAQSYLEDVTAAIDWEKRCVVWYCVQPETGALTYNRRLYYNWETESWSYVDETAGWGVRSNRTSGTSLDSLGNIDAIVGSLDSEIYRASGSTLGMFVSGELSTSTGTALAAELQTGSFQPFTGQRTFISAVTPLVANAAEDTRVVLGYRDGMTPGFNNSAATTIGGIGYAATNIDARYFRVAMQTAAGTDWSDAYGFQVQYEPAGMY